MKPGDDDLRPPGTRRGGWVGDDLAAEFRLARPAPVLGDDIQLRMLVAAEYAGKGAPVQVEGGENFTALADTDAVAVAYVRVPDSVLGIDADPVGMVRPVQAHTRQLASAPSGPMS